MSLLLRARSRSGPGLVQCACFPRYSRADCEYPSEATGPLSVDSTRSRNASISWAAPEGLGNASFRTDWVCGCARTGAHGDPQIRPCAGKHWGVATTDTGPDSSLATTRGSSANCAFLSRSRRWTPDFPLTLAPNAGSGDSPGQLLIAERRRPEQSPARFCFSSLASVSSPPTSTTAFPQRQERVVGDLEERPLWH